jgi:hypothetical protein
VEVVLVFVGDDWAEDHHDVELVDASGRRLARARLPEGLEGITRLHALIAQHLPPEWTELEPGEAATRVTIGIETERGPWVQAFTTELRGRGSRDWTRTSTVAVNSRLPYRIG